MQTFSGSVVQTEDEIGLLRFFVQNPNDSIQRYHAKGEFYEAEDLKLVERWIRPEGVLLDIGANVGNHTVYFARRFPNLRVIPFEMFETVYSILRLNVALNELPNVDCSYLGKAVGRTAGHCDIESRHPNNLGLVKAVIGSGDIEVVALDSLPGSMQATFVKIDVEGAEMDVLHGMKDIISRDRPEIFIEVDNKNEKGFRDWLALNRYNIVDRIKRYEVNCNYLAIPEA